MFDNPLLMLLIPALIILPIGVSVIEKSVERRAERDYRQRAYFQDRYGYRFDAFVAYNQVDRARLAQILQRQGLAHEKTTIRFIQRYEDVPRHVASRYVHYLLGKDQ